MPLLDAAIRHIQYMGGASMIVSKPSMRSRYSRPAVNAAYIVLPFVANLSPVNCSSACEIKADS